MHKVSIIRRGVGALGYMLEPPTEDRSLMSRDELEVKIAVLLGGGVAEKLVSGKLSTGAADDLATVTDIARNMVVRYGMDETLGYVVYEPERPSFLGKVPSPAPSERHFQQIDGWLKQSMQRSRKSLMRCSSGHPRSLPQTGTFWSVA